MDTGSHALWERVPGPRNEGILGADPQGMASPRCFNMDKNIYIIQANFFVSLQEWAAIHDANSGCKTFLPPPEWESWLGFRKTEKSNKRVVGDAKRACMELEAAFVKGKNWINKVEWVGVTDRFRALANCLAKLEVLPCCPHDCMPQLLLSRPVYINSNDGSQDF